MFQNTSMYIIIIIITVITIIIDNLNCLA